MRKESHHRGQSGFTLIEVMIAVVVLATGLLAMAALQGKLATNSADAKARSRVSALLMSVIDDERASGYDSLASFISTACTTSSPTALQTAICNAEGDAGISGLSLAQTVTFWCGLQGGGAFTQKAAPFVCPSSKYTDYKRIQLTAVWTDATGASRSLGAVNVTSSLGLSGSTTFINSPLTKKSITPMVHQPNPSLTPGVIPIAVGANTDSASTNPRPTVGVALPSTTFNTLTYTQGANDTSITSTIQKRVETTVAECGCQYSTTNPFLIKVQGKDVVDVFLGTATYRPTYWNGTKYVSPADAKVTPYSAQIDSLKGSQSDMCSIVCRDHHDAADGSDAVRYDSVTGDYNRYKVKSTGGNVVVPVVLALDSSTKQPIAASAASSDMYLDAARVIRVDGLWRVATDMHSEHMGLLATSPKGFATSSTPDTSSEAAYEDFVVDYMGQKLTQLLKSGSVPVANTIYASHGLDAPDTIDAETTTNTYRYLHGRGLYLDTLEQAAINKLNSVNSSCTSGNYPTCLLPYLPFNTINVTQLGNWTSKSATQTTNGKVIVQNSTTSNTATTCDSSGKKGPTLIRGCVSGNKAGDGSLTNLDQAIATMGKSNSAVAASLEVSPYELDSANKLSDAQSFTVTGTSTTSEFFAALTGAATTLGSGTLPFWTDDLSTTNEPSVQWTIGTASDYCFANVGRTDTNPNPYDCVTTLPLTPAFTVAIGNYNQVVQQTISASSVCANGTGTVSQPTLVCYTVSTTTPPSVSGVTGYTATSTVLGTVKTAGEQTQITISGASVIPTGTATLNVSFSPNGTKAADATCDAATGVPTFTVPTTCN